MCVSEGKCGLKKYPVYPGSIDAVATVPILALECRVVRNIVPDPKRRTGQIQYIHQRRIVFRLMNILVAIIRFPLTLLPEKPVRDLNVECLAVPCVGSQFVAMMDVLIFSQKFRLLLGPG